MIELGFYLTEITFDEILSVWQHKLWPNRKTLIKPAPGMLYLGGYDPQIEQEAKPIFVGLKTQNDELIGVQSGYMTRNSFYRLRGLYVDPQYRGQNLSQLLFSYLDEIAKNEKAKMVWSIPRKRALNAYLKAGFTRSSDWFDEGMEFGPNCYAMKLI